eukprot:ANDGO_02433.mRNA.1 Putative resolvase R771
MYVTPGTLRKTYDISASTLRRWAASGRIRSVRTGSHHMYNIEDIEKVIGQPVEVEKEKRVVLYARVSSAHQEADLQRQIADLRAAYPDAELVSDTASGLNFHRRGFTAVLERVCRREISTLVVAHRDRLCRFGIELIEWLLAQFGAKLVVLGTDAPLTGTAELADDLVAITTYFVSRRNGQRAADTRRKRTRSEDEDAYYGESESHFMQTAEGSPVVEQRPSRGRPRKTRAVESKDSARPATPQ